MPKKPVRRPTPGSLRSRAERQLRKSFKAAEPPQQNARLIHELRVHQIELEMQNDELRRAQKILEESRAKYLDLYEFAPVGYVTLNRLGVIAESNLTAAALLGLPRQGLSRQVFALFLEPDSRPVFRQFLQRLLQTARQETCEVTLHPRKRAPVPAILKGGVLEQDGRRFVRLAVSDITERKEAEDRLLESHEQLRELALQLQHAREEECSRIAQEVHDGLGQALTLLKLDIAWLAQELRAGDGSVRKKLQSMAATADETITVVQDLAIRLRPMVLERFGLLPAIQWWAREFQSRTGIACQVVLLSDWTRVDRDGALALFRIFQETLINVARHAQASRVTIKVGEREGFLTCHISDDGRGITKTELSDPKSLGLAGMRQRAAVLQGKVTIAGKPGKGTSVTVTIPLGGEAGGGGLKRLADR